MTSVRVRLTPRALIFGSSRAVPEDAEQATLDTLLYAQLEAESVSDDPTSPEAVQALQRNLEWCGWTLSSSATQTLPVASGESTADQLKHALQALFADDVTRSVLGRRRKPIDRLFRHRPKALDGSRGRAAPVDGSPAWKGDGPGGRPGDRSPFGGGADRRKVEGHALCIRWSFSEGRPLVRVAALRVVPPQIEVRLVSLGLDLRAYAARKNAIEAFLRRAIGDRVRNLDF